MKPEKIEEFKLHLGELFNYLRKELKLKSLPKVFLSSDQKNSDKILGKTGYYDPKKKEVHLYTTDRHPKDILRSFAHEVVHHWQHEHEQLEKHIDAQGESDPKYAQNDPWLRQMEKQAYLLSNIMFRDWEDDKKNSGRKSNKKNV